MTKTLAIGNTATRRFTIDENRTIDFMGKDARVYATPSLVRDIEQTCRDLIFEYVAEGEDSVGFEVAIKHMAPTLLGMEVSITATITEIENGRVVLEFSGTDPTDDICVGTHTRFVVNVEKTKKRLQAKAAKVASKDSS
jgi:fluoroacetyl-CoA thioesterase